MIETKKRIPESELILNPDGSIFHLHLLPEQLAENVILVGDQGRVEMVSSYFEKVEVKVQNREFSTHTGYFNGKRVSVISTGIGTDNIDIVVNELDALINIDLNTRLIHDNLNKLNLVRLGTSGALQGDIPVDSFVLSTYGIGFDGLLNYYNCHKVIEKDIAEAFMQHTDWKEQLPYPYFVKGTDKLMHKLGEGLIKGITATAPGFYGPQGRELRLRPFIHDLNEKLTAFKYEEHRITNFEMETSALYGLAALLGHNACTICTIIANRIRKEYSKDYKKAVSKMIELTLQRLTT